MVASPIEADGDQARAFVLAGVPTLVEKPVTATAEDADALARLAIAEGVLVVVGHVERLNPCVQLVRAMVAKGSLGRPVACSFRRVGFPPANRPGHDVIHDLAVDDIDVFNVLVGPPSWSGPAVGPLPRPRRVAHVLLRSGEVHGMVEVNWRTPVRLRSFTVTTRSAWCRSTTRRSRSRSSRPRRCRTSTSSPPSSRTTARPPHDARGGCGRATRRAARCVRVVRAGRATARAGDLRDGMLAVDVAARASDAATLAWPCLPTGCGHEHPSDRGHRARRRARHRRRDRALRRAQRPVPRRGDDVWIGPHVSIGTPAQMREGAHPEVAGPRLTGAPVPRPHRPRHRRAGVRHHPPGRGAGDRGRRRMLPHVLRPRAPRRVA